MTAVQPKTSSISVCNPADGSVVGTVPIETPDAVAQQARELRLFQPEWEGLGARGRKRWLLTYQEWVLDNAERITDVVQSETGKVRSDASIERRWWPRCLTRFALGLLRASAARGARRFGIKPKQVDSAWRSLSHPQH